MLNIASLGGIDDAIVAELPPLMALDLSAPDLTDEGIAAAAPTIGPTPIALASVSAA